MKKPFTEFKCDVCGKTIRAEDAMLQWLQRKKDDSNPFPMTLVDIHICCNRKPCDGIYERRQIPEGLIEQWGKNNPRREKVGFFGDYAPFNHSAL